ncbi:MBL fold metallo-hydrolase [Pseudonocardia endophytica]|uniref:Glyoxylase-like metal-dependent hydrolase (Beta-lactamase superfamily II) n=1 Tax=Pseudonocardia endophytica TaxID=401976 RepID=A0A4V2PJ67_PSEEN|nr:MBL fold metallo-hydrolase [Pseudonocardia endophytica]TCK27296.1 glyoxylase-like metal-dependent hydrolase (beta-lactamase superfamily II) [Pseudonocardia endophytica]
MRIGSIEILPVRDGLGRETATDVLTRPGMAPSEAWSCHADELDDEGRLHLPLGGFLVRTGDRVVLVDVGVGAIDNGKYRGGGFPDALAALGVQAADVTDVVFTHLHFDHVGWATRKGEVVFTNATYRVHADDWAHFVEADDADAGAVRKLSPLESRLETFTDDHAVAPGLSTRHTPGHTPGSTVYVVSDAGERALLLGDVVHSVVELAERDWEAVFDVDPAAASVARNLLADEVADADDLVVGAHFPDLAFGRVVTTSGSRRFVSL